MKRCLAALALALAASSALAWNAAGHRLIAAIAWRQMSPAAQEATAGLLARHPDYRKWTAKAGEAPAYAAFLQASTWADDIRKDPRFHDERRAAPTLPIPGLADTARHGDWHYVDFNADGSIRDGQLDRQIERLILVLRTAATPPPDKAYALPWLIHLVGDIHQPLHVGSRDDEGGNDFEIEDPFNPRRPFTSLHAWWDDLPGPPWLRGARLEKAADALLAAHPKPPAHGGVASWRDESRRIGQQAYPTAAGSLLPIVTAEFRAQSRAIAERRLAAAGYRLGRLLDDIFGRVSRETE